MRQLSVCPVPDPKSTTEGRSKLKIGMREAVTRVTHDSISRSKGNVIRLINAVTKNQSYLRNGKAY